MTHPFLIIASAVLVLTIAVQDWLVPALRTETISQGLTGKLHWPLDAAYVLLAVALGWSFRAQRLLELVACLSAVCLLLTAVTNTFGTLVDKLTGGKHSLWHSRFTTAVFVSALALEVLGSHGLLWAVLGQGVVTAGIVYALDQRTDVVEKVAVFGLTVWLVSWALA